MAVTARNLEKPDDHMFCPNCEAEYVEGVTRCADCDVALVAELQRPEHTTEGMKMVRVVGSTEAPMIEELLQKDGIASFLQGEMSAAAFPVAGELTGVRVWVRDADCERARELIDSFFEGGDGGRQSGFGEDEAR